MKILIQNCQTGKYLSGAKAWVEQPKEAQNFRKLLRAWNAIAERNLADVRIVLRLGSNVPHVPLATVSLQFAKDSQNGAHKEVLNRLQTALMEPPVDAGQDHHLRDNVSNARENGPHFRARERGRKQSCFI